jgi:hypothetical protein
MVITINELLSGKSTLIKGKQYLSTKDYVDPFIQDMSKYTNDFRVKIKLPDQMTGDIKDTDITYNRVLIEAVLPSDHSIESHDEVIGLLYGLDIRKPIYKTYRGYLNQACTNLSVFDPTWLNVAELKPLEGIKFDTKAMLEAPNTFENDIKKLKKDTIERDKMTDLLGKWVDLSLRHNYDNGLQNVKISPNVAIEAYKSVLLDSNSQYFIPETKAITMFNLHEALTQIVTDDDKDILNRFEKTMLINKFIS